MKTLKIEEVNGTNYKDLDCARQDIGQFIDSVHNTERLHLALGYKPPVEFETALSHPANHQKIAETACA